MIVNKTIENIKWFNLSEKHNILSFDIVANGVKHPVIIKNDNIACQLSELKKGRRIRAFFYHGENETVIWKEPKNRYRIECRREGAIHLDITVHEKEMEKILLFYEELQN